MQSLLTAVLGAPDYSVRSRVLERVNESIRTHAGLVTVRQRHVQWRELAPGVRARSLVESTGCALRPGQPRRASIIELEPGACWRPRDDGREQREWLVLAGQITLEAADIGKIGLDMLDFHVAPAGCPTRELRSRRGATVYMRAAPRPVGEPDRAAAVTARGAAKPWDDFAPGIRRRMLWSDGAEAAYLVRADAGAEVPAHGHRVDEECLMIDGDLYLGDILLRGGDYQLAPVGSRHGAHLAGSALTLLVRGDVELRFDA